MSTARCGHTATLLDDGTVLIAGGNSAEIYDPIANLFLPPTPWDPHYWVASKLSDGRLLLLSSGAMAQIYDPKTGTSEATENMHGFGQPAALLADGKVLVAGSSSVELFDPISRTFMLLPPMNKPGGRHMTRLLDGDVLFSGAEMPELELYTYGTAGEPGIYLYVTNPVPQINSVSALEFQLGRAAQITVSGHNFISAGTGPSRVTFNGSYYYCQYSTTEDQIVSCVPLSQMNAGTYNVAVFTPGPGGGYSNSIPIVVRAP